MAKYGLEVKQLMMTFLITMHIFVCLALIMIVLLQTGKGADMGAAFGGSGQTLFGGAGPAPFMGKVTTVAAIVFMLTSLSLAYFSVNPFAGSVIEDVEPVARPSAANVPAPVQGSGDIDWSEADRAPAPAAETAPEAKPAGAAPVVPQPAPETQ